MVRPADSIEHQITTMLAPLLRRKRPAPLNATTMPIVVTWLRAFCTSWVGPKTDLTVSTASVTSEQFRRVMSDGPGIPADLSRGQVDWFRQGVGACLENSQETHGVSHFCSHVSHEKFLARSDTREGVTAVIGQNGPFVAPQMETRWWDSPRSCT